MAKTQHVGGYLGILFQWNPQMGIYICCLLLKSGQNIKIYSIRSSDLCVLSRFGNLTVCFLVQIWFPVHRLIENGAPLHCEQNHSPRKNAKKGKAGWNASSHRKVTRYDLNMWIAAHMFSLSWKAFIVLHSHGKWQKQFSLVESKKKKNRGRARRKLQTLPPLSPPWAGRSQREVAVNVGAVWESYSPTETPSESPVYLSQGDLIALWTDWVDEVWPGDQSAGTEKC